jgi:hypothetical protein
MLTAEQVAAIKDRLARQPQSSQRTIAVELHVSRGSVAAIANGSRPDYEGRRLERDVEAMSGHGPVSRCGTCGAKVRMPCHLCHVRGLMASGQVRPLERWPEEEPRIALTGDFRRRYEKLHRLKVARGEPMRDAPDDNLAKTRAA